MRRYPVLALTALLSLLVLAGTANASVQLTSTAYAAGENQGQATITVTRTPPLSGD